MELLLGSELTMRIGNEEIEVGDVYSEEIMRSGRLVVILPSHCTRVYVKLIKLLH